MRKLIFLSLFLALVGCARSKGPMFTETVLFQAGDGGYPVYRIPAVIVTAKGSVLAFCEGRASRSDSGKIHLLMRRSIDGGATFAEQQILWEDGNNTCGNPCPVVDRNTGTIHLLLTHNPGDDSEGEINAGKSKGTRTVWVSSSTDDGQTWSKPREITKDVKKPEWTWYATGPGVGIQLEKGAHKGRLVIPCDYSEPGAHRGNSHVIYSDDAGKTWKLGGEPPEQRFNESQVVELSDGRLLLTMRNVRKPDAPRHRGVTTSVDGGMTFSQAYQDTALPDPICQASILKPSSRPDVVLFSNPASETKREALTVRASFDEARTWAKSKAVWAGPCAYSCLTQLPDGTIGLLYEAGAKSSYEQIRFARFNLAWIAD